MDMALPAMSLIPSSRRTLSWETVQRLVLDGLSSPHTRRAYEQALEEVLLWLAADPTLSLNSATVLKHRAELQLKGLSASSINVRMAAIRKLAAEAADDGLLAPDTAAAILRVKGAKRGGVRVGCWLTRQQSEALLRAPDVASTRGVRDQAILGVLLGAGLRREEVASLTFEHLQKREDRWVIADLEGKYRRIRTVPIPDWTERMIARWAAIADLRHGRIFRRLDQKGRVRSPHLSAQAIFTILKSYAENLGLSVSPHDMRRTYAHLAHDGRAPLEQIQLSLGHSSIVTTEIYLGVRQNLRDAPCDHLGLCERKNQSTK